LTVPPKTDKTVGNKNRLKTPCKKRPSCRINAAGDSVEHLFNEIFPFTGRMFVLIAIRTESKNLPCILLRKKEAL
jgi:hypothetical protein